MRGVRPTRRGKADIEEFLDALRAIDAVLAKERVEHRIRAGERRGVRSRGGGARHRAADLDGDHALALAPCGLQRLDEGLTVPAALEVKQDHLGRSVFRQKAHAFGDVDVELVAGGDAVAEGEPELARQVVAQPAEGTALARQSDATGALLGEREGGMEARHHAFGEIDDAEAVRAEHPHSRAPRQSRDLELRGGSRRINLREPRGEHDGGAHAGFGAIGKRRKAQLLGDGDDRGVDLFADRPDAGKYLQPLNGIRPRIDRINLSAEAGAQHELDGQASKLRRIAGGPDDSDAARAEQGIEHRGSALQGQVTAARSLAVGRVADLARWEPARKPRASSLSRIALANETNPGLLVRASPSVRGGGNSRSHACDVRAPIE